MRIECKNPDWILPFLRCVHSAGCCLFFVLCCDSCKVQTKIYRFRIEHYLFMRLMALFFPLLWANKSIQPTLTFNSTENWVLLSRTLDGTQTALNILAWEKNAIFLDFFFQWNSRFGFANQLKLLIFLFNDMCLNRFWDNEFNNHCFNIYNFMQTRIYQICQKYNANECNWSFVRCL